MSEVAKIPAVVSDQWDWQLHSACRGMSAAVFFNPDNERGRNKRNREANAKAICRSCPVMRQCLAWALSVREPYGVWGATTPDDRQEILAGRIVLEHGVPVADDLTAHAM